VQLVVVKKSGVAMLCTDGGAVATSFSICVADGEDEAGAVLTTVADALGGFGAAVVAKSKAREVTSAALDSRGYRLMVAYGDGMLRLWNVTNGALTLELRVPSSTSCLAYHATAPLK
jgi:hypothetical protein